MSSSMQIKRNTLNLLRVESYPHKVTCSNKLAKYINSRNTILKRVAFVGDFPEEFFKNLNTTEIRDIFIVDMSIKGIHRSRTTMKNVMPRSRKHFLVAEE